MTQSRQHVKLAIIHGHRSVRSVPLSLMHLMDVTFSGFTSLGGTCQVRRAKSLGLLSFASFQARRWEEWVDTQGSPCYHGKEFLCQSQSQVASMLYFLPTPKAHAPSLCSRPHQSPREPCVATVSCLTQNSCSPRMHHMTADSQSHGKGLIPYK